MIDCKSIQEMRSRYGDALLERCKELATKEDNEKKWEDGTYLCAWLKRYVPLSLFQCSCCRRIVKSNLSGRGDHDYPCSCGRQETLYDWVCIAAACANKREVVTTENMREWAEQWVEGLSDQYVWYLRESSLAADGMSDDLLNSCLITSKNFHELYANTLLQITKEPRDFVTVSRWNRDDAFLAYTPGRAWAWTGSNWGGEIGSQNGNTGVHGDYGKWADLPFPIVKIPVGGLNPSISTQKTGTTLKQFGGTKSDVWSTECSDLIPIVKPKLDAHAELTNDKPIPRYQMIIDPNQFVRTRKDDNKKVWVPSEFDISPCGDKVTLVGGNRAHFLDSDFVDSVTTPVLSAALPLLAKLKRPALLLEGQRLQVVVKAQCIEVPARREQRKMNTNEYENGSDDYDDSDYIGLWHIDGTNERVVAVILYYYNIDESLQGGNMEFLDRAPLDVLGRGDCWNNARLYGRSSLREAIRPATSEEPAQHSTSQPRIANCSVPIKAGTMLVFSNYQMVHRVLRMANMSAEHAATRDFVALFVIDPAVPLVPARCHLASNYLYERTLSGTIDNTLIKECGRDKEHSAGDCSNDPIQLDSDSIHLILEFLGTIPTTKTRRQVRNKLLKSQLQPTGYVGASQCVYSTGNGCFSMIGWIDNLLEEDSDDGQPYVARTKALNVPPREVGRGLSETLSIPSDDLANVLDLENSAYRSAKEPTQQHQL